MSNLKNTRYLHVKIAGGATAQCLGLMNAIYASNKLRKPFKISYYPYSTGGYWPFAIADLCNKDEILDSNKPTKGLVVNNNLEVGKIILNHPLMIKQSLVVLHKLMKCELMRNYIGDLYKQEKNLHSSCRITKKK